jgi:RNA polymerase sigma-70 factor (ECF subfamily)
VDEPRLIERVLGGDPAAERELYDAHVDRVYRLAFRMAGDEDLAEEFTQETFIRAFTRLRDFRGDAALSTWLHAIAVSVVLNGLRKVNRSRQREVRLSDAPPLSVRPAAVEPTLRQRLRQAVDALSDRYRTVFVMHDIEGYTHEEIGTALQVATGTSKAMLFRARAKLREQLADIAKEYAL